MGKLKKIFTSRSAIQSLILTAALTISSCGKNNPPVPKEDEIYLQDTASVYYINVSSKQAVTTAPAQYDFSFDNRMSGTPRSYGTITGANNITQVNIIDNKYEDVNEAKVKEVFQYKDDYSDISTKITNENILSSDWGTYNITSHVLIPNANKTIVVLKPDASNVKNSKLYKMRIVSIYKGAPANPSAESPRTYLTLNWDEIK